MNKKTDIWEPVFTINVAIARALMGIEAAKSVVENTILSPVVEAEYFIGNLSEICRQSRVMRHVYSDRVRKRINPTKVLKYKILRKTDNSRPEPKSFLLPAAMSG